VFFLEKDCETRRGFQTYFPYAIKIVLPLLVDQKRKILLKRKEMSER